MTYLTLPGNDGAPVVRRLDSGEFARLFADPGDDDCFVVALELRRSGWGARLRRLPAVIADVLRRFHEETPDRLVPSLRRF